MNKTRLSSCLKRLNLSQLEKPPEIANIMPKYKQTKLYAIWLTNYILDTNQITEQLETIPDVPDEYIPIVPIIPIIVKKTKSKKEQVVTTPITVKGLNILQFHTKQDDLADAFLQALTKI